MWIEGRPLLENVNDVYYINSHKQSFLFYRQCHLLQYCTVGLWSVFALYLPSAGRQLIACDLRGR